MTKVRPQREKILEHLLDLLVVEGVVGLTVRKLAERSHVAIGTVQYYFPSKIQMIRAAAQHALTKAQAPLQALADSGQSPRQQLVAFAHLLVPKTPDDRAAHIWLEIATLAAINADVAREHSQFWQAIEDVVTALFTDIPDPTSHDTHMLAVQLLAFLDGLTIAVISEPGRMSGSRAHTCIDHWFETILS